jgi:glycine betaine catabolism A
MGSRAYRDGGVLVLSEHHIAQFHAWVTLAAETEPDAPHDRLGGWPPGSA